MTLTAPPIFELTSTLVDSPKAVTSTVWSKLGQSRWIGLDLVRGAAAILVFLFHYAGMTEGRTASNPAWEALESTSLLLGSVGTNLLLLLCGLLIGKSVSHKDFSYREFVVKRSIRLYFPYIVILLLASVFAAVFPAFSKPHPDQNDLEYFLSHLLLVPGLFPDRPFLTVTWTLSYIFAGYCVLPFLASAYRRLFPDRRGYLGIWIASLLVCLGVFFAYGAPSIRLSYIPAGCILAELLRQDRVRLSGPRHLLPVIGIGFFALLCRFGIELHLADSFLAPTFKPLVYFLFGLTAVSSFTLFSIFSSRFIRLSASTSLGKLLNFTGKRGYSFYLLHGATTKMILFFALYFVPAAFNWWVTDLLLLLFCFASALAISHLSYELLETSGTTVLYSLRKSPQGRDQSQLRFPGVIRQLT